jgi:hypothetical protein
MSSLSKFNPHFTSGQQRYLINGSNSITGYLKCDGSIVSQSTYPALYAQVGLIKNGVYTWTVGT